MFVIGTLLFPFGLPAKNASMFISGTGTMRGLAA